MEATFHESSGERKIQSLPLSHLSIELGHLYFEDFNGRPEVLRQHFRRIVPWAAAVRKITEQEVKGTLGITPRISTCFLIDDYFGPTGPPSSVLPEVLAAAESCNLRIDYVARESACADAEGIPLAGLVENHIVVEPAPDTNGSRPPAIETGWLSNGQRSPSDRTVPAMGSRHEWAAPRQNVVNRHSVFVDVQLWSEERRRRVWSCAFLAAVWQLVRLGLLRYAGMPVAVPKTQPARLPNEWSGLPAVIQLNSKASPMSAYQTISILPTRFLSTEQAVRTVLSQVAVDSVVTEQVLSRAAKEGLSLPVEAIDRIKYVFVG